LGDARRDHYCQRVPNVLLATDADWIFDEVDAALSSADTGVYRVHAGVDVLPGIKQVQPDLVILDLQIGNMGGMAACMSIRNEEEADRLPITAVLMLLDRAADTFLARRSRADGWLIKPLDAFRLRKACDVLLDGYSYYEGVDEERDLAEGEVIEA
jgi:DNA-binding response OmpR family regulator